AGRASLYLRLHGLLEIIQMERDRLRADHLDERADLLRAERRAVVLLDELRDTDVRDDEHFGRALANDRVRAPQARIAQRGALAPDAHPQTVPRRGLGQRRVHPLRAGVTPGHPRDQEW